MKKAVVLALALAAIVWVVPALAADEAKGLPDGFKGFRGVLKGTIVSKTDGSFVIKVTEVVKLFPPNKATKAEVIVGQTLTVKVTGDKLVHALAERKAEETVEVGVFNSEGDTLTAIEYIHKVEAAKTAPAK